VNVLDRIIAWLSPEWALRRLRARAVIKELQQPSTSWRTRPPRNCWFAPGDAQESLPRAERPSNQP